MSWTGAPRASTRPSAAARARLRFSRIQSRQFSRAAGSRPLGKVPSGARSPLSQWAASVRVTAVMSGRFRATSRRSRPPADQQAVGSAHRQARAASVMRRCSLAPPSTAKGVKARAGCTARARASQAARLKASQSQRSWGPGLSSLRVPVLPSRLSPPMACLPSLNRPSRSVPGSPSRLWPAVSTRAGGARSVIHDPSRFFPADLCPVPPVRTDSS